MVPGVVVPVVLAIMGGVIAWKAIGPSQESADASTAGEAREQRKESEENRKEAGPPISTTVGFPAYYASRFSFPERTHRLGVASEFGYGTEEFAEWFSGKGARPVGVNAARFTVTPLHKGTVIIQGMRVADVRCKPTEFDGTAFVPPPIGDGGDEVEPVDVAFDLTEAVPQPRTLKGVLNSGGLNEAGEPDEETWQLGGQALRKGVYLDGGEQPDARTFDVYFLTGDKDCEYGLELNVTSGETDDWYPVKLTTQGYRDSIAGQAGTYRSVIVGESDTKNELRGAGRPFTPVRVEKGPL